MLFAGPAANAEPVAQVRAHLGPDCSLPVQFLSDMAHGNLGQSLTTGQPVRTDLPRIPLARRLFDVAKQRNVKGYVYRFHTHRDYRTLSKA